MLCSFGEVLIDKWYQNAETVTRSLVKFMMHTAVFGENRKTSVLTGGIKYVKLNPALHVRLFFMYGIFSAPVMQAASAITSCSKNRQ